MKKIIFTLLCLFSFALYAQDDINRITTIKNKLELLQVEAPGLTQTININISQTTLSNFLLAISKVHSLNLNVSPELNSINIVNNFSDVSVKDILIFLVKEYNLDIEFTGNILSIKKYSPPPLDQKEVGVFYNPVTSLLTLDLKGDKLDIVFRKIMDDSGKNLLFSPDIQNNSLTLYIKDVPFDLALEKLAQTNDLILSLSKDGFYVFDGVFVNTTNTAATNNTSRRSIGRNFQYKVLDTLNKTIEVDFQNTPISDIIYTIAEDLNISIFTASPLDNAGVATVTAKSIHFDLLLNKIFESAITDSKADDATTFTYKKDENIYYFGTQGQLSLKQMEVIQLVNRSVNIFSDPKRSYQSSFRDDFVIGGTNYNGQTTNRQNNTNNNSVENTALTSIETIIPEDIKEGLIIKTDFELNSFIVSGPGVKVERFKEFLSQIDKRVPLILIEVMILEVNRSAIVETGISFGLGEQPSQTIGDVFPSTDIRLGAPTVNRILGSFNGFGSLNIGRVLPEFYLDIKANETSGNIKVLSTPQLSALNGHKAFLSSSQTTYYTITNQTFIGTQNPQTTEIKNYVPISAELALEFRPFVSGDGLITMDVRVVQSGFTGVKIDEDAPPDINTREFSSIIIMRDQDVAVLGGIERIIKDDSRSGVPFLARIPVINLFFSKKRRENTKKNLTILIKPTVIR